MTWAVDTRVEFQVRALAPVPKGSHRAFLPRGSTRPVITDSKSAELRQWEKRLREAAALELERRGLPTLRDRPCEVQLVLWLTRPAGDFATGGKLRGAARAVPWVKPDIDKLQRTIFDALTGCVLDDDSRICRVVVEKRYVENAANAGVAVRVIALAATVREEAERAAAAAPTP